MKLTRRDFTAGLAVGITAPYVIGSARQGAYGLQLAQFQPELSGP